MKKEKSLNSFGLSFFLLTVNKPTNFRKAYVNLLKTKVKINEPTERYPLVVGKMYRCKWDETLGGESSLELTR